MQLGLRTTNVESQDLGGDSGSQVQKNPFDLLRCKQLQPDSHSKLGQQYRLHLGVC